MTNEDPNSQDELIAQLVEQAQYNVENNYIDTDNAQFLREISMMPLYLSTGMGAMEEIEALEHQNYLLIAPWTTSVDVQNPNSNTVTRQNVVSPKIFRVTKNILGRAIANATVSDLDSIGMTESSATFMLPQIPFTLIKKLDAFFRSVHKLHNTESVLILTFDPTMLGTANPQDGWGCLIPTQTNTAGACDYEPTSIMADKPEHVFIVGSAHSHPEMSAFFSGTDHADQDDWDGVHITYAWKGNSATEYHISLIMGGKEYNYTPEQMFAKPPDPEVDVSEVDGWITKVSKAHYVGTGTHSNVGQMGGIPTPTANQPWTVNKKVRAIKLPADAPDPKENLIIAIVDRTVSHMCPFCDCVITKQSFESRRCTACRSYIIMPDESVSNLIQIRAARFKGDDANLDLELAPNPIVLWTPSVNGSDDLYSEDQRIGASPKA